MAARPTPRTLTAALLLTALAVTSWLNLGDRDPEFDGERLMPRIDHSLGGFRATGFDENGRLAWRLEGERVDHLGREGGYLLTKPRVAYYQYQPEDSGEGNETANPPWTLSAPAGDADERLDNLLLRGGVLASRDATEDMGRLTLRSDEVWLRPREGLAGSRLPSEVREENAWQSDATTFTLDRTRQRLEQTGVHDRFEPAGTVMR